MILKKAGKKFYDVVYKIAGEDKKDLITIALSWKRVVGEILAERSFIYKYSNRVLYIGVRNNIWMQELLLKKDYLISQLNKGLEYPLKDIIFLINTSKGNKYGN